MRPYTARVFEAGGRVLTRSCILPTPARYELVVPARAAFPSVQTLIVSGDEDTSVPEEISRALLDDFPVATFSG